MFEFSTTGALAVTGVFLVLLTRKDVRYLGTFVILPVLLTLGLAVAVLYTESAQLVPGAEVGLAAHPRHGRDHRVRHLHHRVLPVDLLPGAGAARAGARTPSAHRRSWTGCRGRRAGPVGVQDARLRLPDLDLRGDRGRHLGGERLGALLGLGPEGDLGVHHLAGLHVLPARRATAGWKGRRAAYLAGLGYATFLFNYLVVNIWLVGFHSYAGVG
jgi:hypothetical protein